MCVSTDDDVLRTAPMSLPKAMRPGATVVKHGTGLPRNAVRLAVMAREHSVDAPVSGGRPGALSRTLNTPVGGPEAVVERCTPVFAAFSAHAVGVAHTRAGQMTQLFNNAVLMGNEPAIADVVTLGWGGYQSAPTRGLRALEHVG